MVETPFDLFVSFAPADRPWVEGYLLDALHQAGVATCSDASLPLGTPRIVELERAIRQSARALLVCTPEYFGDRDAEFVDLLAESHGLQSGTWQVIPLLLRPVMLPARLAMLTKLDATNPDDWPATLARLFAELHLPVPSDPPVPRCPYPGMRSFVEEEKASFFGRDSEIHEILHRLRIHPFWPSLEHPGAANRH